MYAITATQNINASDVFAPVMLSSFHYTIIIHPLLDIV